jgi:hypothetical protein
MAWPKRLGLLLLFVTLFLSTDFLRPEVANAQTLAGEQDTKSTPFGKNPVLDGISNVLIFVNYFSFFPNQEINSEVQLPSALQRKSLQNVTADLARRFTSAEARSHSTSVISALKAKLAGDAKILVIDDEKSFDEHKDLANQPGTLTLALEVAIEDGSIFTPPLPRPVAAISLYVYRPGLPTDQLLRTQSVPGIIALNGDNSFIEAKVRAYIFDWMILGKNAWVK